MVYHRLTPHVIHTLHTHTFVFTYVSILRTAIGAFAAASSIYSFVVNPVGLDPRLFRCDGGGDGRIFKIDAHAPPHGHHAQYTWNRPRRQRIMLPLGGR